MYIKETSITASSKRRFSDDNKQIA